MSLHVKYISVALCFMKLIMCRHSDLPMIYGRLNTLKINILISDKRTQHGISNIITLAGDFP